MKGRIGTSTQLLDCKKSMSGFFAKVQSHRDRVRNKGKSALQKSKMPAQSVVVIPADVSFDPSKF